MNLHHPRTSKKAVLFIGDYDTETERWYFGLNEVFKWDDLSPETKTRLRLLPEQAENAFAQKYPRRLSSEWRQKTQKYRRGSDLRSYQVPLGHLVDGLHSIYLDNVEVQQQARVLAHNWHACTAIDNHYRPLTPHASFNVYRAY
ncbi:hypothetical protein WJX84_010653 [Apatococcus fuscideae]|uniref:Uncharacterized protein n=1 Tax=Apatococcus fuscideae TaxID=2026836 RepID=A0AAW1SY75_9CHLO